MPFLGNIGSGEWLVIGLVVLVLFGNKKMTEVAKGLGESGRELKKARKEFEKALNEDDEDDSKEEKGEKGKEEKKKL